MATRRLVPVSLCGAAILLSGCTGIVKVAPDVDAGGMPNAELALQRSMQRVDAALRDLGGVQPASRTADGAAPAPAIVPAELNRPVSFAWSGPIDAGAKALADRIGYRLVVSKPANPRPIIVAVNRRDVPILDLFEALGVAAGSQATVIVDPDHHQVDVQHHV